MIRQYLKACDIEVQDACIAIACPVTEDWVAMTNHSWAFSIKEMKASTGLSHLEVINDFTAVSMAIPMLSSDDVLQFGGGDAQPGKPIAVYGAGTGLGVAHRCTSIAVGSACRARAAMSISRRTAKKRTSFWRCCARKWGTFPPSVCCPGRATVNLYRAIVKADNRLPEKWEPKDITERALADSCIDCRRAPSLFCVIMGRFGGNRR